MSVTPHTILLRGYGIPHAEGVVSAAVVKPGYLLDAVSDGTFKPHAVAGGNGVQMVAMEDSMQGDDIDDTYAIGDRVFFHIAQRGEEFYMFLKDGESVTPADYLESAGDGTLQKHVADDSSSPVLGNNILFRPMESVDLSDSSAADPSTFRIRVMAV